MKALRHTLLAACLATGALPGWAAAADSPPPPPPAPAQQQDLQRQLDEARHRLEEASREVAQLSSQLGRNFAFNLRVPDGGAPPRALLGVSIDNNGGDAKGARVREVSPGSAAAEAGIKAGDLITGIGGKDLTREADPGRALVEQMRQIEPNLKLQVEVLRDGRKMSFDVTPRPAPVQMIAGVQALPGMPNMPGVRTFQLQRGDGAPGPQHIEIRTFRDDDGTRFRGMEFATLSDKLGSYFGVKAGVLVVRAGANSPFKLEDGDVILSIAKQEVDSPDRFAELVTRMTPGVSVPMLVQRHGEPLFLQVQAPPRGGSGDG